MKIQKRQKAQGATSCLMPLYYKKSIPSVRESEKVKTASDRFADLERLDTAIERPWKTSWVFSQKPEVPKSCRQTNIPRGPPHPMGLEASGTHRSSTISVSLWEILCTVFMKSQCPCGFIVNYTPQGSNTTNLTHLQNNFYAKIIKIYF